MTSQIENNILIFYSTALQVHRAFLLASMFIGLLGFATAFIANYPSGLINFKGNVNKWISLLLASVAYIYIVLLSSSMPDYGNYFFSHIQSTGIAHFAIGMLAMVLHIANVN